MKLSNFLILIILGTGFALASPLVCVMVPSQVDGTPMCPNSPGLGQNLYAVAGTTVNVGFNDNFFNAFPGDGFGDWDFRDAWLIVATKQSPVPTWDEIDYTYVQSISWDSDQVRLGTTSPWLTVGQSGMFFAHEGDLLTAFMLDSTTGHIYQTGPGSVNLSDGDIHAWVGSVPEPSTYLLLGSALTMIALLRRARFLKLVPVRN